MVNFAQRRDSGPNRTQKRDTGVRREIELKGKMVLIHENPAGIKWLLAKKGVLGAINTFTENPALENGRQWINAWGDNGWAFTRHSSPLLCFSIPPRQATFLKHFMERPGVVRVKAKVDSRYYSGIYPYVSGVIAGTTPEEEVLTLGHTSEQGAHENPNTRNRFPRKART